MYYVLDGWAKIGVRYHARGRDNIIEFAVAGLIINRVVSAIDVLYLKNSKSPVALSAFLLPEKNDGVSLNVSFSLK